MSWLVHGCIPLTSLFGQGSYFLFSSYGSYISFKQDILILIMQQIRGLIIIVVLLIYLFERQQETVCASSTAGQTSKSLQWVKLDQIETRKPRTQSNLSCRWQEAISEPLLWPAIAAFFHGSWRQRLELNIKPKHPDLEPGCRNCGLCYQAKCLPQHLFS